MPPGATFTAPFSAHDRRGVEVSRRAMTTVRWVLCATDFSPAAWAAWETAQLLGVTFHVEVVLLHVLSPSTLPGVPDLSPVLLGDVTGAAYRTACQELDRLVVSRRRPCVKVTPRIELGPPATRILQVADEQAGGVLVLGVRRHGPLGRLRLGSVADRIVREGRCPVLTVPAPTIETAGSAPRPTFAGTARAPRCAPAGSSTSPFPDELGPPIPEAPYGP